MPFYTKNNCINHHNVDMATLKKDTVILYQIKRFGGVDYQPALQFVAKVTLAKPFLYAPGSWAIQVKNLQQDERLKTTHVMYKDIMAVDVEDIIKIGL